MPKNKFVEKLVDFLSANAKDVKAAAGDRDEKLDANKANAEVARCFDRLPVSLLDQEALARFCGQYIELFDDKKFSKAQMQLLREDMVMQACQEILDGEGEVREDLIGKLKLVEHVKILGMAKFKNAVIQAYLNYAFSSFAGKLNDKQKGKVDAMHVDGEKTSLPRAGRIANLFSQKNVIDNMVSIFVFSQNLKRISNNIYLFSRMELSSYYAQLCGNIALIQFKDATDVQRKVLMSFWIDVMHVMQAINDYNSFHAIYSVLQTLRISVRDLHPLSALKIKRCEEIANPQNKYKVMRSLMAEAFFADANVVPLYLMYDEIKCESSYELKWKKALATIFVDIERFLNDKLSVNCGVLYQSMPKLLDAIPCISATEAKSNEEPSLLSQLFSETKAWLFPDLYTTAVSKVEHLYREMLASDRGSVVGIFRHATDAETALKQLPNPKADGAIVTARKEIEKVKKSLSTLYRFGLYRVPQEEKLELRKAAPPAVIGKAALVGAATGALAGVAIESCRATTELQTQNKPETSVVHHSMFNNNIGMRRRIAGGLLDNSAVTTTNVGASRLLNKRD